MKKQNLDLTNYEKISDNHYFGTMTFKDYISFAKGKVIKEKDNTIVHNAKLEAIKYNNDINNSEISISPTDVFISEDGIQIFDVFTIRMIFDLEERFMNNKLGINVYTVCTIDARVMANQLWGS